VQLARTPTAAKKNLNRKTAKPQNVKPQKFGACNGADLESSRSGGMSV
jgi:hypothetical protein